MVYAKCDPLVMGQVYRLVARDVRRSTSEADLSARLARNGFGYRNSGEGRVLVTIPQGVELGPLPG